MLACATRSNRPTWRCSASRDKEDMPDLRVDAIARLLVGTKVAWLDACREVFLHASLLAPKKAGHSDVSIGD